ncbi:MAG: hypothetical protein WCQ20_11990 [Synechococcaceae cyanobacterium ELA739]|jgi:hypothetical protein
MARHDARSEPRSNRFLRPEDRSPRPFWARARGPGELFAEGSWHEIRVTLERQGWIHSQIELIHDQLRHGWPLVMAKHNVTVLTGHCPLRSGRQG